MVTSSSAPKPGHGTLAILAACVGSVAAAFVLDRRASDAYQSVLGIAHPMPVTLVVASLGFVALQFVRRRGWIASVSAVRKGWAFAVLIGVLLPIPVIVVDCLGGFAADINALAPDSLLFYPSVALLAEMTFHVAPLAIGALIAGARAAAARNIETAGLAIAVLAEPVVQVVWGASHSPVWANAYVGFHLLVFNVIGVYLLRRYGFMRAYLYRVSYYAVWHIGWGQLRLGLLFSS